MPEELTYLEVSKFDESNPQGYDDEPDFLRDVWPSLISHAGSIPHVYVRLDRPFVKGLKVSKAVAHIGGNIRDLGPLNQLPDEIRMEVKDLSFYGGHLSIFYELPVSGTISAFLSLWKRPPKLCTSVRDLGLKDAGLADLHSLIDHVAEGRVLATFGHDGDPLFLFGHPDTLRLLT